MKILLATVLAALFISFMFVWGGYSLYRTGTNSALLVSLLGSVWLVSLWLLFSTIFSRKRKKRRILINKI